MTTNGNTPAPRQTISMRIILGAVAILSVVLATLLVALSASDGRIAFSDAIIAVLVLQPLSALSFWVQAPRLALIAGSPVRVGSAFIANSISATLFNVIPGRASELLKPLVLNRRDGLSMARGLSALVAERLLDTGCVLLMLCVALAGNASRFVPALGESAIVPTAVLAAGVLVLLAISVWPGLFRRIVDALPSDWLRRNSNEFLVSMQRLGNVRTLAVPILFTIATWATSYLNVIVASYFLGATPLDASQALVVMLAGTIGMVVTIAPGGLGTFEAAIVAALTAFDYSVADSLVMAVVLRVGMVMPALAFAAWYLAHGGMVFARRAIEWRDGDRKR